METRARVRKLRNAPKAPDEANCYGPATAAPFSSTAVYATGKALRPRPQQSLTRRPWLGNVLRGRFVVYVIDRFQQRDLLDVMRLSYETLEEEYPYTFFTQMADHQARYFRVAREVATGRVLGFLVANRQAGLEGRILLFAVDPRHQGQGIGKALLRNAQRTLTLDNVRQLQLEVRTDNGRAIAFYQHHGFNVSRLQERAYRDGSDALLMTKPLF